MLGNTTGPIISRRIAIYTSGPPGPVPITGPVYKDGRGVAVGHHERLVRGANNHDALLAACKELRDALAGAMRVVADHGLGAEFADEMSRVGVADGIGLRAQAAIAEAEKDL